MKDLGPIILIVVAFGFVVWTTITPPVCPAGLNRTFLHGDWTCTR